MTDLLANSSLPWRNIQSDIGRLSGGLMEESAKAEASGKDPDAVVAAHCKEL
jgi:hypothetical protein